MVEEPEITPVIPEAVGVSGGAVPEATEAAAAGAAPFRRRSVGRRFIPRRRVCALCAAKITTVDYKDASFLRRFISDRGRISTRRRTGTCAKHQRVLSVAVKRARHLALLPYTAEHIRRTGGIPA
ncbi:MAG: 30S ribosomal protein S18 [Chloroflexi bacterium]|nr:30S ribosomal protein S18 [Chloroflexota bacterium]